MVRSADPRRGDPPGQDAPKAAMLKGGSPSEPHAKSDDHLNFSSLSPAGAGEVSNDHRWGCSSKEPAIRSALDRRPARRAEAVSDRSAYGRPLQDREFHNRSG